MKSSRFRLIPLLLCLLSPACQKEETSTLSLLPATWSGRVEAAVHLPAAARLELAWHGSNPATPKGPAAVEVWAHREGEKGELLETVPFDPKASRATASIDLGRYGGDTSFLRVTAGATPVAWTRADLIGRGKPASWRIRPRPGAPDVLVYLIDTLRPDVLGVYGGPGPTPNIDRLASGGTVFERAYSTTSWTRPAVASLFTALPPSAHRVASADFSLPEGALTLAERFRLRGYQTIGVTANGHVIPSFNFDQGFEVYDVPPAVERGEGPDPWNPNLVITNVAAGEVHAMALRHLAAARDRGRPLFLYIHTVEPHSPYHPPEWLLPEPRPAINVNNYLLRQINEGDKGTSQVLQKLALAYRGAVAYADHELGSFLTGVSTHLDLDRTVLVVASDHGEGFYEHALVGHHNWVYEELTRVPLILRGPGVPAGRHNVLPTSLVDIAPTLIGLVDNAADTTKSGQGRDLLRTPGPEDPAAFSEYVNGAALVQGEWKLTYRQDYPEASRFSLFNLRRDPLERNNLAKASPDIAERLEGELRAWNAAAKDRAVEPLPVDASRLHPGLVEKLKALGYIR